MSVNTILKKLEMSDSEYPDYYDDEEVEEVEKHVKEMRINDACDVIEREYKMSGLPFLAKGEKGSVRIVCLEGDNFSKNNEDFKECSLVLKEQDQGPEFVNEVHIMNKIAKTGFPYAPKIRRSFICGGKGLIIMDRTYPCPKQQPTTNNNNTNTSCPIDRSMARWLCEELYEKTGIFHMDNHSGNFMYDEEGELVLIDFGLSLDKNDPNKIRLRDSWHDEEIGVPRLRPGSDKDKKTTKIDPLWENFAWSFMMQKINDDKKFVGGPVSEVTGGPYFDENNPLEGLKPNAPSPQKVICEVFKNTDKVDKNFNQFCENGSANNILHLEPEIFDLKKWYEENDWFDSDDSDSDSEESESESESESDYDSEDSDSDGSRKKGLSIMQQILDFFN